MTPNGVQEPLLQAQAEVSEACRRLLSPTPESLDRCAAHLSVAMDAMRTFSTEPSGKNAANPQHIEQARQVHRLVQQAHLLLENAWAFRQNWARRLNVMAAGYAPGGEPGAIDLQSNLSVQG